MGVHGLWDLLSPVGRRVSVETLAGKRLAIDASIWMVQFMKAMRDEKGEMVRNAHLLGFFRRICKLLFLRTKPVFVFDGGTPALKRRTVVARRRQRENAQAKIRKMAEKLLLNHVKSMRLKMLAEDLKDQKSKNNSKATDIETTQSYTSGKNDLALEGGNQETIDELLAASVLAEECGGLYGKFSMAGAAIGSRGYAPADTSTSAAACLTMDEVENSVEMIMPTSDVNVDPVVFAALPPSVQLDVLAEIRAKKFKLEEDLKDPKAKTNTKGKEVLVDQGKNSVALEDDKQKMVDEMLAAAILAEDCADLDREASTSAAAVGTYNGSASASGSALLTEKEVDESDDEMIVPVTDGNVDPAVLAALPPSMQLDLLVQMREKLMAENRQKYQKVKKAPQKFSELQIEAYLKTVAFRREIDQVQKAASGRGMAGVQTSRIASEANREFIFSSSFSGDNQLLTSGEAEKNAEKQKRIEKRDSSLDVLHVIASTAESNSGSEPTTDEAPGESANVIQTFLDEMGRMRVSRRRAMGVRMTRDLQRNLDLMKEFEQERTPSVMDAAPVEFDGIESISGKYPPEGPSFKAIDEFNRITVSNNTENLLEETRKNELSKTRENCIKISFDDDAEDRSLDGDDEIFSRLVAGQPVSIVPNDKSASDCEWEEGVIGNECDNLTNENRSEVNSALAEDGNNNESDLEWEEGVIGKDSGSLTNQIKLQSTLFHVEDQNEEADVEGKEGTNLISDDNKLEMKALDVENFQDTEVDVYEISANIPKAPSKGSAEEAAALQEAIRRSLEDSTDGKSSTTSHELEKPGYTCKRLPQWAGCGPDSCSQLGTAFHEDEPSQSFVAESDGSSVVGGKGDASISPIILSKSAASVVPVTTAEPAVAPGTKGNVQLGYTGDNCSSMPTQVAGGISADSEHLATGVKEGVFSYNCTEASDIALEQAGSAKDGNQLHTDVERNIGEKNVDLMGVQTGGCDLDISMSKHEDITKELVGANLDDELLVLDQEYKTLGDEQRKLERNADFVNSEMFVECQELLQMFGLPYIIAPMEAEAQCAYMELANLVDGVVTDDSDVFLFGGRSVYKNIFDDRKYVETYFMKDIESELGLNREQLIRMALLLGSDYTEGVSGIGIVNAIEVVNAFPEEDGFHKFREWIESPDPSILGKVGMQSGSSSKKKGSKASKSGKSNMENTSTSDCTLHGKEDECADGSESIKQIFMHKHRNVSKNWHIPASFPSDAVIFAYTSPQVDKSTEPFAWGKPDIFTLRRLCWEKFGWASQKADELLQPVLKEYNKHETQLRLEAFYTFNERFAKIRSKRIKQAVKGITRKGSFDLADTDDIQQSRATMKGGTVRVSNKKSNRGCFLTRGKDPPESSSPVGGSSGLPSETDKRRFNGVRSGKTSGKGSRKAVGRGKRKDNLDSTNDETSSDDSDSSLVKQKKNVQFPGSVRRSKRARKTANYVEKDEESDEPTHSPSASNQKCGNEPAEQELYSNQSVLSNDLGDSSRERQSASEDPLPADGLAEDYLAKGGGFCAEEEQPENDNLPLVGGFCLDENEEEAAVIAGATILSDEAEEKNLAIDQSEPIISKASVSDTKQALLKGSESDFKPDAGGEHETRDIISSNVAENIKEDILSSMSAFSAIPYLKRKKRN